MRFLIAAVFVLCCSLCLAEKPPFFLDEFKSLTVEQSANLVAKYNEGTLRFNRLTSIDWTVAHELAKFEGRFLSFRRLTSIDKDVAQELAKFEGEFLDLGGLTSIDKDVAQELAKFQGIYLHLDGLTSIDKDVAQELAKFEGLLLFFSGLTSIDKDVAQELAKFKGSILFLKGLTAFDQGVSAELQKFEGQLLLSEAYELGDVFNESQAFSNDLPRTFTNSIGISMKLIPAGKCRFAKYRAEVEMKPFYMSETEVTNIQGKRLMGFSPSGDKGDDWPITGVSYQEAMKFCSFLSVKEQSQKRTYRLPTAEEWKYAFLAGTETEERGFGITVDQAWCEENGWSSDNSEVHPVGQKKPNNWGLYDMLGNVKEFFYTTPSLKRKHENRNQWHTSGVSYTTSTRWPRFLAPTKSQIASTSKYSSVGMRIVMIPDE